MSLPVLLLLEGFAYVVLLGVLTLLRRERLSMQFAIESIVFTGLVSGMTVLTGFPTHPALFLALIYLLTMRVRLLVDLATVFARRGQFARADQLYTLASRLWPDPPSRLILLVNQATSLLQQNKLDEAVAGFTGVLQQAGHGYLGVKYEAAAHYNLAIAYLRKNMEARAVIEFNAVMDAWPASQYARRAEAALEKHRRKDQSSTS